MTHSAMSSIVITGASSGIGRATALRLASEYGDHPDDPRKDDPFDVAVWRASDDGEPAWPSPWAMSNCCFAA